MKSTGKHALPRSEDCLKVVYPGVSAEPAVAMVDAPIIEIRMAPATLCCLVVEPTYPSEKWWSEFISWEDDIPNKIPWTVINVHGSSHHQPDHHHIPIVVGL